MLLWGKCLCEIILNIMPGYIVTVTQIITIYTNHENRKGTAINISYKIINILTIKAYLDINILYANI